MSAGWRWTIAPGAHFCLGRASVMLMLLENLRQAREQAGGFLDLRITPSCDFVAVLQSKN